MPVNVGAVGGVESIFTVAGTLAVPPALVALQVIVPMALRLAAPQPSGSTTGDSGSETLQVMPTGVRYQPFAPSGAAGVSVGVITGGVGSSAICTALSASRKPAPQSGTGTARLGTQASALAGVVMIAYSSSTPIAGLAERISAAMPAAAGAAALVPRNGVNGSACSWSRRPAPRARASRAPSGVGRRLPAASKSLVTGPVELYGSGVVGVEKSLAATVSAPLDDAASGEIAPDCRVGCSNVTAPTPFVKSMYFMNGLPVPGDAPDRDRRACAGTSRP